MKKLLVGAAVFVAAVAIVTTFRAPPADALALANPASVYCVQLGGTETIYTATDGSQDGYCRLPNGTQCNSWDLYRGGCPGYPAANSGVLYDTNGKLLKEGDLISANAFGDPDIFIIHFKPHGAYAGYKRLFLNPAIFAFYGHLGGFSNVHPVTTVTRDLFETSGLFRNCETNDPSVWATEVTGEDVGVLHHVQMTGNQAIAEDALFFDRVFCINSNEDNFYAKSITPYYHLSEIPVYFRRACQVRPACLDAVPRCLIPEPVEGWCPSPTPTPTPTPTPRLSCNQVCSTDTDCAPGLSCYQPPFYCPPGQYCTQVMPSKVCRLPSNPTDGSCVGDANQRSYLYLYPITQSVSGVSVTVTAPNGGEAYGRGDSLPVSWQGTGVQEGDQFRLTFWYTSGSLGYWVYPYTTMSTSVYIDSASTYWLPASSYRAIVELYRNGQRIGVDESDRSFSITH